MYNPFSVPFGSTVASELAHFLKNPPFTKQLNPNLDGVVTTKNGSFFRNRKTE